MIRYDIQKGVQKIKTKTFLAISGLGLVLGGGAMSLAILGSAHAVAPNCTVGVGKDYLTIQAAVSEPTCTTVTVDPGVYSENVVIGHSLTLNGAKAGVSTASRTAAGPDESTVIGTADGTAVISVQAANVKVDGFSIKDTRAAFAAYGVGVKTAGDNAVITNNIMDTITTTDAGVNGTAQAVYLEGGPDSVSITNNQISNVHSIRSAKGVLLGDNGATNAPNNTLIQGNIMTGITSDTKGAYGVSLANIVGGTSGLQIKDNTINGLSNTTAGWIHVIGIEGDAPGVVVSGNTISNLTPFGTDAVSVWFESEDVHYDSAKVNENNFNQTTIPGIAVGVAGTASLDGTCNYWGDPSGPSNAGGSTATGTGAGVTGLVTYAPWLNSNAPAGACHSGQVKIQIFKYVDGVQATAANANSATFPMTTTFTSPNLGNATNAPFTLSPTPWGGIGQPYEADFIGSDAGANYTASEVTTGNNVVGTACDSTTPYALTGYSSGSNLAQAQAAPKTTTAPQFTNLQSDQVMIVYNKTCHNVTKPVITYPANGATKLTTQMDKVDWTNVTGATAYEYRSFTDAAYTAQAYDSGFTLANSEIPTPGTPAGNYYLQVRAQDADGNISPWSNDATHPYVVHVVTPTTPPTTKDECRDNGWKTFNNPSYKNKDKCIDYVVKHGHKVKGDVHYTAYSLKREAEFDMNTYDNNKGEFEYWDNNNDHYKVKVSVVKVNGHDAWFAGVVTKAKNPSNVGKWLFAKVHDGSTDQISGSFTDQTTATAGVNSMSSPTDGPFNVTKGNLKVN